MPLPLLPDYIQLVFVLTTLLTLLFIYSAVKKSATHSKRAGIIFLSLLLWLAAQAMLTMKNFYNTNTTSFPPKFLLLILPPLLTILLLFITKSGKRFIDSLPVLNLTYLHIVRIPVELVLYWLCLYKAIPELMTFAGRNFDILSGISAPFIAYFGIQKKILKRKVMFLWNVGALLLLLNIVINAVLSAPFSFQQFAFDQPNIAVLNFPFSWLPCFIVPAVLFSHLVSLRRVLLVS
jgi:hypothetical protein